MVNKNNNSRYTSIFKTSYNLCSFCAKRNDAFAKFTNDNLIPNLKTKKIDNFNQCFICRGLFEIIDEIVKQIVILTTINNKYEFYSYFLGSSIPTLLFDNEDHFRSIFKVRGRENIKSAFNKEIRKKFKIILKKTLQPILPDLMITVLVLNNFNISIELKPRSYYLICRYTKKKFMHQKNKNYINIDKPESRTYLMSDTYNKMSVENIVKKKLLDLTSSRGIKFTWIGSEDPNSMVLGKGRVFIAEIIEPKKRRINKNQVFKEEGIVIRILEKRESIKKYNISYVAKTRAYVKSLHPIASQRYLNKINQLNNSIMIYRNKSRIIQKKIYRISAKKLDEYHFIVTFLSDGGLFIKQFIEKKISINPNISSQIDNECICIKFDIIDIDMKQ